MSNKYLAILTQVVRQPRHVVGNSEEVLIEIERATDIADIDCYPQIVDFSRGGCRLRYENDLQKDEPVVLRITDNRNGLMLEMAGAIRWCRQVEKGLYEVGCQFDQLLDYEQLGELFLAGFLAAEEISSQ